MASSSLLVAAHVWHDNSNKMTIVGSLGDPPQDEMAAIRGTFRDGGSVLPSTGSAVAIS